MDVIPSHSKINKICKSIALADLLGNFSTEIYNLATHKQIIKSQSTRSRSKDFTEFATCIAYSILKLQRQRQDPHYGIYKKFLVDKEWFVLHFNTAGHWVDISASRSEQYLMFTAKGDSLRLLCCQVLGNPVEVLPAFIGHPRMFKLPWPFAGPRHPGHCAMRQTVPPHPHTSSCVPKDKTCLVLFS